MNALADHALTAGLQANTTSSYMLTRHKSLTAGHMLDDIQVILLGAEVDE